MPKLPSILTAGILLGLSTGGAHAALLNASFETPTVNTGNHIDFVTAGPLTSYGNWNWTGPAGIVAGNVATGFNPSVLPSGYNGAQYAYLQGNTSSVAQSFTLTSAANVNISWVYAGRPTHSALIDGNTNFQVTAGSLTYTGSTVSDSNFQIASLSGTLAAGTYTLLFDNNAAAGDHTLYIDNVTLTVAEPGTIGVLGLGLMGLVGCKLRGRGKSADLNLACA